MDENKSCPSADIPASCEAEDDNSRFPLELSRWTLPSIPDDDAPALSEMLVRLHGKDPSSPQAELMRSTIAEADPATRHLMLTNSFLQNEIRLTTRQNIDLMRLFSKRIDEQYEDAATLKVHHTERIGLIFAVQSDNEEACHDALDKLWENSTRPILGIMSAMFSAMFQKKKNKDGQMVSQAYEHNSMAKTEKSIREDMNSGPKPLFFSTLFLLLSAAVLGLLLFPPRPGIGF